MPSRVSLIVVAAGRGARLGAATPKQYLACAGKPLICHALEALAAARAYCAATVVIHPDDRARYESALALLSPAAAAAFGPPAFGGDSRQQSVRAGLEAQSDAAPDLVLIHDAARIFPSAALIERAVAAAERFGAAAPGAPLSDTVKQIDARRPHRRHARPRRVARRPDAAGVPLPADPRRASARRRRGVDGLTDDAAVAAWAGHDDLCLRRRPGEHEGDDHGRPQRRRSAALDAAADVRVGQGFDVHAFAPGDHVWLGGVRIPHDRSLAGHSDADVCLHALADALYGALGDGDIGAHFPPSDPRWRGAASSIFLSHAAGRVRARGGIVAHLDATLICEAPKIGPHREAMRARIAEIAGIALDRVAVKATTSEGLGFAGRREGIACLAAATIRLPAR